MACDAGVPESMCYTSERKKEPVLGWFGEHKKLEKETHELRADSAEPEEEKKEENPELTAARQRKQRIAAALNKPRTDELRRRFWEYDMNSDGKLDIDEVKRLLRAGKPTMSNGDIEAIFKRVDKKPAESLTLAFFKGLPCL